MARCWRRVAGTKSFQPKDKTKSPPPDDPGNPTVNFRGEKRSNETHASKTDPEARLAKKGKGKGVEVELLRKPAGGESQRTDRRRGSVSGQRDGGTRCCTGDAGANSWQTNGNRRRGQRIRHAGLCEGVPASASEAACGAKSRTAGRQRDRWPHYPAPELCLQSEKAEANRRMLWLAEDDCSDAQAAPSRRVQSALDFYLRLRRLQSGA